MIRSAVALFLAIALQASSAWGAASGVAREGKEWLQPSLFVNLSWADVAAACPEGQGASPRVCNGMLGSVDVTGYQWASISDLFALLTSYGVPLVPFVFYGEQAGSAWAPEILGDFHPTASDSGAEYTAVWGNGSPGEVAELTDAFDAAAVDSYEFYGTAGAASDSVGVLLWRSLAPPRPSVPSVTVTPTGSGRYNVFAYVRDFGGVDACALALASGRCVFTCGPGSLRCEGGTAELPKGSFTLLDLPTEADGSIILQVFLLGHVSRTVHLAPSQFDTTPLPFPRGEPITYTGDGGAGGASVSACFNLSADASRLTTTQSECAGGSALAFEAEIDASYPLNDPGCDATISIRLSQDIPVKQSFSVTSEDGARVTGYFREAYQGEDVIGTVQDASGCRAEWTARSEDFFSGL